MKPPVFSQGSTHVLTYNDDTDRYELWKKTEDGPRVITSVARPPMVPGERYYFFADSDDNISCNGRVLT